ncbi:MAG: molybdenum cofactor biosynthesis protein MoaE [Thermoplasmataceae archaeon]
MIARLQAEKIDPDQVISKLRSPKDGAIVVFLGTVRNTSGDLAVSELIYEAYEEMAIKSFKEIMEKAKSLYGIDDAAVVHRIGRVKLTEDSVIVAVSAPHRKEAFVACEFIIDRIKELSPIWKKDVLVNGTEKWRD